MPEFYGLDDFRAALQAAGWRIERDSLRSQHNDCNWYGWIPDRTLTPDCRGNDKPPSWNVQPYEARVGDAHIVGATLQIVGRAGDDDWLKLQVYTMHPSTFFERLPVARARLAAAWAAAAAV